MRQQINLYQPIFTEERKSLAATTVAGALIVVAVALTAFSIHASRNVDAFAREVEALRQQQAEREALLEQMGELPAEHSLEHIEARAQRLTTAIDDRKRALQILQSGGAGQTSGFAARLEALARRHVDRLWIDHIVLSGTNGSMSLGGAALDADIVPAYLQSLAREPVLAGTRFDDFVIERPGMMADAESRMDAEAGIEAKQRIERDHVRFRAGNRTVREAPESAT